MSDLTNDIAQDVAREMKAHAPRDRGRLRRAIAVRRNPIMRDHALSEVVIRRGKNVPNYLDAYYWHFVEFGTSDPNRPADPFIRPAVRKINATIGSRLRSGFVRRFERRFGKRSRLRSR